MAAHEDVRDNRRDNIRRDPMSRRYDHNTSVLTFGKLPVTTTAAEPPQINVIG